MNNQNPNQNPNQNMKQRKPKNEQERLTIEQVRKYVRDQYEFYMDSTAYQKGCDLIATHTTIKDIYGYVVLLEYGYYRRKTEVNQEFKLKYVDLAKKYNLLLTKSKNTEEYNKLLVNFRRLVLEARSLKENLSKICTEDSQFMELNDKYVTMNEEYQNLERQKEELDREAVENEYKCKILEIKLTELQTKIELLECENKSLKMAIDELNSGKESLPKLESEQTKGNPRKGKKSSKEFGGGKKDSRITPGIRACVKSFRSQGKTNPEISRHIKDTWKESFDPSTISKIFHDKI